MSSRDLNFLRRLLRQPDVASITQGVELISALGDGDFVDALLDGVEYDADVAPFLWNIEEAVHPRLEPERRRVIGRLRPNDFFSGRNEEEVFRFLALLGLVSRGPGARAVALRERLGSLMIGHFYAKYREWDAALLDGLSNLEELVLWMDAPIRNLGVLATRLPRLRRLRVNAETHAPDIDGIASANLEELEIVGRCPDLSALAGSRLKRLILRDDGLADLRAIGSMPCLESLRGARGEGGDPPAGAP